MTTSVLKMQRELVAVTEERDRLAVELQKLREQKPVAWMHDKGGRVDTCHDSVKELWIKVGQKQNTQFMREIVPCRVEHYNIPLYAAPVPAPAVPDWNVNIERIRDVMHMLGISIEESVECFSAALPTNINHMTLAMKRHLQKLAGMTAITPTPFIPDDDTRRNDAEFAAQQEVGNAPSVPDEWRTMLQWLIGQRGKAGHCHSRPGVWDDDNGDKAGQPCEQCAMYDRARVLLQSADHSEQTPEKVAPDCRTCANRGRINGLSQESYCDSCVYEGRGWRQNHFVDARKMVDTAKRRCEACAILPCSCK